MNLRPGRRRNPPDLNLTPLIDVVFLLLIFFMVSTTFSREAELTIELPEAEGEQAVVERDVVEIVIDTSGQFYINGQQVVSTHVEVVRRALREAGQALNDPRIVISADRNTPHQAVVTAMDAARQLGYVNLTFATRTGNE